MMYTPDYRMDGLPSIKRIHMDYSLTDQAYTFHMHQNATELIYVESGRGIYMINHQYFPVEKDDIICVESGLIHAGASSIHDPMRTLLVIVSDVNWVDAAHPHNVILPTTCPVIKASGHSAYIHAALNELHATYEKKGPDSSYLCGLILSPVLVLLRKHTIDSPSIWNLPGNSPAADILCYIYEHYAESITLESLSSSFFMSAGHINHLLQQEYSISPINYLIDVRLSKAKGLLIGTNMSIADIAASVGYSNPSHFTKLFEKRIGYLPNDYRTLHKNAFLV